MSSDVEGFVIGNNVVYVCLDVVVQHQCLVFINIDYSTYLVVLSKSAEEEGGL